MTKRAGERRDLYRTDNMALAALLHLHDFPYTVTVANPSDKFGIWIFTVRGRLSEAVDLIRNFENGSAAVEPVSFQRATATVRDSMRRHMDERRGQSSRLRQAAS